jgi:acetyltransferase-like isoleucine patch superfamily enzyme
MPNRLFHRLLIAPQVIGQSIADRWIFPALLRFSGLEFGSDCKFVGMPTVRSREGTFVVLGNRVSVYSRMASNALGLPHPTILAAMEPGSRVEIGDGSSVSGASIVARRSIQIGKEVMIGAGACIWDSDFHPLTPEARRRHPTREAKCAPIVIEDEVFIGAKALILKGVTIGRGAIVGAGAVVTRSVNPREIVAGNPARVVGHVPEEPPQP